MCKDGKKADLHYFKLYQMDFLHLGFIVALLLHVALFCTICIMQNMFCVILCHLNLPQTLYLLDAVSNVCAYNFLGLF